MGAISQLQLGQVSYRWYMRRVEQVSRRKSRRYSSYARRRLLLKPMRGTPVEPHARARV